MSSELIRAEITIPLMGKMLFLHCNLKKVMMGLKKQYKPKIGDDKILGKY